MSFSFGSITSKAWEWEWGGSRVVILRPVVFTSKRGMFTGAEIDAQQNSRQKYSDNEGL